MLHIWMGRARTGKSERVLKKIAALGDSSQQILLVPEHASHVAEMDVCRACGDAASRHAEVLTFKLLATRVLQICGGSADVTLDNGGKLLTLQRALTELAPALKVYRRASQRAAFLESLLAVMEELQAYAIEPETLAEKVEELTLEIEGLLAQLDILKEETANSEENQRLMEALSDSLMTAAKELSSAKETIERQKAEIERLTEALTTVKKPYDTKLGRFFAKLINAILGGLNWLLNRFRKK